MNHHALLVVGELCPDIVVAGIPAPGGLLRFGQSEDLVDSTIVTLGSSAGITACAAARAGAQVRLLGVVGDDEMGRVCRRWLTERHVDASAVRVDHDTSTGSSVILVRADDAGGRQILTHLGAMAALAARDVSDRLLRQADHLHISSFFLHVGAREALHHRMARARDLGLGVSLDTNHDPARRWAFGAPEAVAQSDILFCNEAEARGLAGTRPDTSTEDAVQHLLTLMPAPGRDHRFPAVVHKLGAEGAEVHTALGRVHVQAPRVRVVDTIGAGDTLAGTTLAALLDGADWPQALALAVAAGSASTSGVGGVAGQPTCDETARLASALRVTDDRKPWRPCRDNET